MDDDEYELRINQAHDYLDEFACILHEKFERECGVANFAPRCLNTPENKAELQAKYPRNWREAFAKFKACMEEFIAEVERDEKLPDGERLYSFDDREISGKESIMVLTMSMK